MALVLGAAFGPRATHVEVREADSGALVATGAAHHDLGPGGDPTAWWRSLTGAVAQTGQRDIAAISVVGGHPGLVLLDGAGAVLAPREPWSDEESAVDARRLQTSLGAERWARRVGALPGPRTAVSRLACLRRTDADTFARIGAALLPHDWLTYRLAGRLVTDRGSASLSGAWSPAAEGWLGEVLELVAPGQPTEWWRERLPAVLGPAERADWLDAPVFELLGLRGRPLVAPGTSEAMAIALALGIAEGRAALSLGAAIAAMTGLGTPLVDPTGVVRSRADATGRHLGLSTSPGGTTPVDALRRLLRATPEAFGAAALATSDPSGSLLVLPGVDGRRGALVAGLDADTTPEGVARAAYEGVACAALDALDRLATAGAPVDDDEPLLLAGPAADLAVHAQVVADLAQRPVHPVAGDGLPAAGACIQAAAVLAETDPAEVADAWALAGDAWVDPDPDVDPEAVAHRRSAHRSAREREQDR